MYFDMDLSEAFFWVSSADLIFGPMEKGHGCYITLKSEDQKRNAKLLVLNHGKYYQIGEMIVTGTDPDDFLDIEEPRHPALLCQEYKIPSSIPKDSHFIGPMNQINMIRILRLVQSTLLEDTEMKNDVLFGLNLSFPSGLTAAETPSAQSSNIVAFTPRVRMMG